MIRQVPKIVCIGGANVDKKAEVLGEVRLKSSNPVKTIVSCGGVSRNIAEYLGRLGYHASLLTCLGDDKEGEWIKERSQSFIDFTYTHIHPTLHTGAYIAILDQSGDLVVSVSDMQIYDHQSFSLIEEHWRELSTADYLVLDTNFPKDMNAYLIKKCNVDHVPLCVIPGSYAKANKLPEDLRGVSSLIVNKEEAELLSDTLIERPVDFKKASERLLEKHVEKVVITNGSEGIFLKTQDKEAFISSLKIEVVDVTGAGDAFSSGYLYACTKGLDVACACRYGIACAVLSLKTNYTVPIDLDESKLLKTYKQYFEEYENEI